MQKISRFFLFPCNHGQSGICSAFIHSNLYAKRLDKHEKEDLDTLTDELKVFRCILFKTYSYKENIVMLKVLASLQIQVTEDCVKYSSDRKYI